MAIRIELNADKDRGPGHGILRIEGMPPLAPPVDLAVERNQGRDRFLRAGGVWQASEAWFTVGDIVAEDSASFIRVGPEIVDPIVGQPPTVAYRLTIATASHRGKPTVMTVNRGLLGSRAAAGPEVDADVARGEADALRNRQAEEEERRRREAEEEALRRFREEEAEHRHAPPPPVPEPPPPPPRRRWPLIAAGVAPLVLAAVAAGAWFGCLVPGFGPASCAAPQPSPPVPEQTADLSCAGLTPDACYEAAKRALADKKLERGRQLCQRAAALGSVEANLCVARMYDPATWTQADSPAPRADWETATYWYETAAKQGNTAGLAGAGRLLCEDATTDFEHQRGLDYLRQALAKGGDPALQQQIAVCEAKTR